MRSYASKASINSNSTGKTVSKVSENSNKTTVTNDRKNNVDNENIDNTIVEYVTKLTPQQKRAVEENRKRKLANKKSDEDYFHMVFTSTNTDYQENGRPPCPRMSQECYLSILWQLTSGDMVSSIVPLHHTFF